MAWIDLLLSANHEEREIFFNGNILTVRRGSFITSYDKISDRWGWSSTKVRKFFNTLIKQEMIQVKSDEKKTVVSLVNNTFYQGGEHTENIKKT
jgi:DNA replication protein DnaD